MKKNQPINVHCETCDNKTCFINLHCNNTWKKIIGDQKDTLFFSTNQPIISEGAKVRGIYFIYSGSVKVQKKINDEDLRILRFANSGEVLGHRGYGEKLKYPISATASRDSSLCFIPNELFFDTIKSNALLGFNLVMFYASELKRAEERIYRFTTMNIKQRICAILEELVELYGITKNNKIIIELPISRKDLASYAAMTYESTIRIISTLTKEGVITFVNDTIEIIDRNLLKKLASLPS